MRLLVTALAALSLLSFAGFASAADAARPARGIRLSSTIGPVDAGIVPLLAKTYQEKTGIPVSYEKAGTGATLEKAKKGGFDLVMVHARKLEDKFIADGYGLKRYDVMYNDFVILGPKNDPAGIRGMKDAAAAFAKLAAAKAPFISRDDMSGTNVKEREIWAKSGVTPEGSWYERYVDGKKGNKATTLHAEAKQAYTLMDRATYLTLKKDITLVPLVERDPIMLNLIAVIGVNPQKVPGVDAKGAADFIAWLRGDQAQAIIKTFGVNIYGEPLFFPNAQKDQ
jgi:tungstate transport system substrate-binding protein